MMPSAKNTLLPLQETLPHPPSPTPQSPSPSHPPIPLPHKLAQWNINTWQTDIEMAITFRTGGRSYWPPRDKVSARMTWILSTTLCLCLFVTKATSEDVVLQRHHSLPVVNRRRRGSGRILRSCEGEPLYRENWEEKGVWFCNWNCKYSHTHDWQYLVLSLPPFRRY